MKGLKEKRESPLDFLPEAMVDELLEKHEEVVSILGSEFREIGKIKPEIRKKLEELRLLKNVNELLGTKIYPTTAGVDGTYAIIKQLSIDTICTAAVAVEGLIPPQESRYWEKPRHIIDVYPVEHSAYTARLCRAIMFSFELELAAKAPHRVVFLDGSLTTPLIGIGQGLVVAHESEERPAPEKLRGLIFQRIEPALENYLKILTSPRVDQIYAGVPKYSSRQEVISELKRSGFNSQVLERSNDKSILSIVLRPGEVVGPLKLEVPQSPWHLSGSKKHREWVEGLWGIEPALKFKSLEEQVLNAVSNIYVIYFRTSPAHPTLRVEICEDVARNKERLSILLEALQDQARVPGLLEPFPLYLADLFVKHAYLATSELREAAMGDVDKIVGSDFPDVFLALQEYRTEGGFD